LAECGKCLILVHQLYLPDVFLLEFKIVSIGEKLELVWQHMGANFLDAEETDVLGVLIDMEVPLSKDLSSDAVNRLICLDFFLAQKHENCGWDNKWFFHRYTDKIKIDKYYK
jgi:hypothetical protein